MNGHCDLQLGAKGFFTIIFFNLEDRERIFEGGPYFLNSDGLYLRPWKERFNPDTKDLNIAPVWIRLYSLPTEFWDDQILADIENALGTFVKSLEQMKVGRYTIYARICIYLDLSKPIPKSIKLQWRDEEWIQALDYEQIPF